MAVLVSKQAPDFTANAVMGNNEIREYTLSKEIKGKYAVIFFYPLDFTFVCPSELIAFDHRLDDFKKIADARTWEPGDMISKMSARIHGATASRSARGSRRSKTPFSL